MYTAGGGGNSHTTLSKFQYMPGGQGGGWAPPTAGEASSISGRNANTTADTALRCSQGVIGHLLSVAFCVEILRFVRCSGARFSADGGDHGHDGVQDLHAGSGFHRFAAIWGAGTVHRAATVAGRPCWRGRVGRRGLHWGSAETEHGAADAVVVAALSANERSDQHSGHSRFLRGDRGVRTDPSMAKYATRFGQWTYRMPSYGAGSPTT
jgi:hypothetical protein